MLFNKITQSNYEVLNLLFNINLIINKSYIIENTRIVIYITFISRYLYYINNIYNCFV